MVQNVKEVVPRAFAATWVNERRALVAVLPGTADDLGCSPGKAAYAFFQLWQGKCLAPLILLWFYSAVACGGEISQVTTRKELNGKCGFVHQNSFRKNALGNILQKKRWPVFSPAAENQLLLILNERSLNDCKPEFFLQVYLLLWKKKHIVLHDPPFKVII